MSTAISVRLPDEVASELEDISNSKETKRPKSFHVQKAIEQYLADRADVQVASDRLHDTTDSIISIEEIRKGFSSEFFSIFC